jgi:hypothetical protein
MVEELSLIRFGCVNFWATLMNSRPFQPITTLLVKLVEGLLLSEPELNEDSMKRLKWIYDNTHTEVEESLPVIELAVFKNLDRGLNREIDIGDKSFFMVELYKYLDEVSKELAGIVVGVARKYSLDIPMSIYGNQGKQSINFGE